MQLLKNICNTTVHSEKAVLGAQTYTTNSAYAWSTSPVNIQQAQHGSPKLCRSVVKHQKTQHLVFHIRCDSESSLQRASKRGSNS